MNNLYYINCLTNLHVGSGDVNYNIVDQEVEKDPVTGNPVVHASGIKGALRDAFHAKVEKSNAAPFTQENENSIFGKAGDDEKDKKDSAGAYRFLNAQMLSRPLRCTESAYISVTTLDILNDFVAMLEAFGIASPIPDFNENIAQMVTFGRDTSFLISVGGGQVEGERTGELPQEVVKALKPLLGERFAIAKSFDDYDLPVIARNNLQTPKGNLWYEEYVPHHSRFYCIIITPDESSNKDENLPTLENVVPKLVQVGGNASVGYGYCKFEKAGIVR